MKKSYTILGDVIPWQRAGRVGNRYYDTQKKWKMAYGILLSNQHGMEEMYSGPIHLDAVFYFHIPTMRQKKRDKVEHTPHMIKPDLDNCVKFIMDCCNGILFKDDCIVSSMCVKKVYGENPRTELIITKI